MEAIILAGGIGTRIKSILKDIPKPMAKIHDRPFLQFIMDYLEDQGMDHIILSVGYKKDIIKNNFKNSYRTISISYCEEDELLGTGGAIKKALNLVTEDNVFILNGDTMFKTDYKKFLKDHIHHNSFVSLALKNMDNVGRYGVVKTGEDNKIIEFVEKKVCKQGTINAGLYLINKNLLNDKSLPQVFSFEKDFMEKYCGRIDMYGFSYNGYFIDIGVPEDYYKAQIDFKGMI